MMVDGLALETPGEDCSSLTKIQSVRLGVVDIRRHSLRDRKAPPPSGGAFAYVNRPAFVGGKLYFSGDLREASTSI